MDIKDFLQNKLLHLKNCLRYLIKKYKINHKYILRSLRYILQIEKKIQVKSFLGEELAQKRLAWWHNLDLKKIKKYREKKTFIKERRKYF